MTASFVMVPVDEGTIRMDTDAKEMVRVARKHQKFGVGSPKDNGDLIRYLIKQLKRGEMSAAAKKSVDAAAPDAIAMLAALQSSQGLPDAGGTIRWIMKNLKKGTWRETPNNAKGARKRALLGIEA